MIFTQDKINELYHRSPFFKVSNFYGDGFADRVMALKQVVSHHKYLKEYSLFNTTKYMTEDDPEFSQWLLEKIKTMGLSKHRHHMQEYNIGSFARKHTDTTNPLTIITLVDRSEDAVGGYNIFYKNHKTTMDESNQDISEVGLIKEPKKAILRDIAPYVMMLDKIGDSIIMPWGAKTRHAVSALEKGTRTTFIHWVYV